MIVRVSQSGKERNVSSAFVTSLDCKLGMLHTSIGVPNPEHDPRYLGFHLSTLID